ncbi:hypothetical protein FB567DRAFT_594019 [Paraphoma chrysanthemicola]|uniref:Uncharacterized protein n=1 Tax=Paraphoma chrysanthemicola TaxID=798071 RepID=A0A8K0VXU9_9PLEO|nr:hypothetical protein FB567DRAFT_594019 [Paraphoma chrysanthemicola]
MCMEQVKAYYNNNHSLRQKDQPHNPHSILESGYYRSTRASLVAKVLNDLEWSALSINNIYMNGQHLVYDHLCHYTTSLSVVDWYRPHDKAVALMGHYMPGSQFSKATYHAWERYATFAVLAHRILYTARRVVIHHDRDIQPFGGINVNDIDFDIDFDKDMCLPREMVTSPYDRPHASVECYNLISSSNSSSGNIHQDVDDSYDEDYDDDVFDAMAALEGDADVDDQTDESNDHTTK